jgi:tetratricopeptide (TPR) repeat protein
MRANLFQVTLLCCVSFSIVSCGGISPSPGGGAPTADGSGSAPEKRKEGSKFVQAAYELRKANKLPESLVEINKAIAIDKNNYYAWQLRGDINSVMNNTEDAIEDLTKAIELKPGEAVLYYTKGKYEGQARKFDDALKDAKQAVQLDPNNMDYLYMRASGYAIAQEYKKAIVDATRVINANPKNQDAYKLRAVCYFKSGDRKKSAADEREYQRLARSNARVIPVNSVQ